jgi:hypothetical protein
MDFTISAFARLSRMSHTFRQSGQAITPRVCRDGARLELRVEVQLPYEPRIVRLPLGCWCLQLHFEIS